MSVDTTFNALEARLVAHIARTEKTLDSLKSQLAAVQALRANQGELPLAESTSKRK